MDQGADRYWQRTSALMWTMFAIWVFFSFVIHFFVNSLNEIKILGFPLGFYMAAQGSLIAFVVVYFAVFGMGSWYLLKLMTRAPQPHEPEHPNTPAHAAGITPAPALGATPTGGRAHG